VRNDGGEARREGVANEKRENEKGEGRGSDSSIVSPKTLADGGAGAPDSTPNDLGGGDAQRSDAFVLAFSVTERKGGLKKRGQVL